MWLYSNSGCGLVKWGVAKWYYMISRRGLVGRCVNSVCSCTKKSESDTCMCHLHGNRLKYRLRTYFFTDIANSFSVEHDLILSVGTERLLFTIKWR